MSLLKASLAFSAWAVLVCFANASEVTAIPEIGAHQPIVFVEKNVHPQNRLVVYTKLDADGRFLTNPDAPDRPMIGFYWLMDGKDYKAVNWMIKNEIRRRFTAQWISPDCADHFIINMNDLKEVKCDIKDPKIEIYARVTGAAPGLVAEMNLGPSDQNMRIKLTSIYTVGRAFPPAVEAVTLKGEEIVNGSLTGKKIERTYRAVGHAK